MTRYFEVTHRDCAARIGRLMLNRRITTPAILSSELLRQNRGSIIDCGCVWDNHRSIPSDPDKLLLLPHRSLPLHAPQELIEQFDAPIRMRHDGAAGVVVHPAQIDTSIPDGLDLYLIGAARMLGMRAGLLVDCVLKLKNNIRADTAVYAPALATPENLAILIYLRSDHKGVSGRLSDTRRRKISQPPPRIPVRMQDLHRIGNTRRTAKPSQIRTRQTARRA